MKNQSVAKYIAFTALGFMLLAGGVILVHFYRDAAGIMRTLPYICIGIGTGVFGGNLGTAIRIKLLRKNDRTAKQVEIEERDERNVVIRNRAKGKAYDMMILVFGALMMGFALMQVDLVVVLAFVAAYLFVVATNIYYIFKFVKEM